MFAVIKIRILLLTFQIAELDIGSRIFSRGTIFKKFSKKFDKLLVFWVDQIDLFRAFPEQYKDSILTKNFAAQAICWKTGQNAGNCWQKMRFFGARFPSKLVNIGHKGAFRKNLGLVGLKMDVRKQYQRGEPSVGEVVEPLREWGRRPPTPPPPSPPSLILPWMEPLLRLKTLLGCYLYCMR